MKTLDERKLNVERNLIFVFGRTDPVKPKTDDKGRWRYDIRCEFCGSHYSNLKHHLLKNKKCLGMLKGKFGSRYEEEAAFIHSYYLRVFLYISKVRYSRKPLLCDDPKCGKMYDNMLDHLKKCHQFVGKSAAINKENARLSEKTFNLIYYKLYQSPKHTATKGMGQPCSSNNPNTAPKLGTNLNIGASKKDIPTLDEQQKELYNIKNDCFMFFLQNQNDCLDAFERHLQKSLGKDGAKQHRSRMELIWNDIDQRKGTIKPGVVLPENVLANPLNLEDYFWLNRFEVIVKYQTEKAKGNKAITKPKWCPHTVKAYFSSFRKFLDFSIDRLIFVGIPQKNMDLLNKKFTSLSDQMRRACLTHRQTMYDFKASTLLTPKDFIRYGESTHVQGVRQFLQKIMEKELTVSSEDWRMCVDSRNYLMVMLALANGLRTSNLMNMTVQHVNDATGHDVLPNVKIIKSRDYKTVMLYGEKWIVTANDMFQQLRTYIDFCSKIVNGIEVDICASQKYVFQSTKSIGRMKHSSLTKAVTSSFRNAGVVMESSDEQRVSCSRLRASIATDLAGTGEEDIKTFANAFMKHRPDVCQKNYVRHWSQREGLRISMKCMDHFHVSEDVREDVLRLREAEKKKSLPTMEMVIRYMQKHLKFDEVDNSLEQALTELKDLNLESSVINNDPPCV